MQVSADFDNLLQDFQALSMRYPKRQTGLVDMINMGWNKADCKLSQQFKNIYTSRMDKLQDRLTHPQLINISQVIDNNQRYCIRGIIKRLEEVRVRAFQKNYNEKYNSLKCIYSGKDQLQIEDKTGKLKLVFKDDYTTMGGKHLSVCDLPYGVNVILEGKFNKLSNKFHVKTVITPSMAPQHSFQQNFVNKEGVQYKHKQMLVLSEPSLDQLLFVKTMLNVQFNEQASFITALVIVGGLEMKPEIILKMAQLVCEMRKTIDVFVMPSTGVERQKLFPLPPYSGLFFTKSHREIGLCSNPQLFQAQNGMKIHISCGQNVKDFLKNGAVANTELLALEWMVNFSHYCPTAPFSLKTEPYMQDYMVIEQVPNMIISGKCQNFDSKLLSKDGKRVLLVTIPAGKMGLVSLNSLSVRELL